jgi:hypothetical protein
MFHLLSTKGTSFYTEVSAPLIHSPNQYCLFSELKLIFFNLLVAQQSVSAAEWSFFFWDHELKRAINKTLTLVLVKWQCMRMIGTAHIPMYMWQTESACTCTCVIVWVAICSATWNVITSTEVSQKSITGYLSQKGKVKLPLQVKYRTSRFIFRIQIQSRDILSNLEIFVCSESCENVNININFGNWILKWIFFDESHHYIFR